MVSTILFKKVVNPTLTEWYDVDQTLPEPREQHRIMIGIDTAQSGSQFVAMEYDSMGQSIRLDVQDLSVTGVYTLENPGFTGDTFDTNTNRYTFLEGRPNRWKTPDEQTQYTGFGSSIFGIDKDGNQVELSKLTSVTGTANQITVTQTSASEAQIGIASNLEFESLTVNGDAAIHGQLTADDGLTSGANITAGGAITATNEVSGKFLKLHVYQQGDTLPSEPGSLFVYNNGSQITPRLVTG